MTINSAVVCAFFFEPVYDDGDGPPPSSPSPPPSPSAPKKRGRKKSLVLGGANHHRCKVCHNVYAQATSTGYTNLLTHLRIKHPDWEEMLKLQQLESAAVSESGAGEANIRSSSVTTSSATSTAPKQKQAAGRKRGPVYDHFEDVAWSSGNKQKKMRCVYCHKDTPQISGRLKLHLSAKCPEAPEDVKTTYAGAVNLVSNKLDTKNEVAVKVDTSAAKSTPGAKSEKQTTKQALRSSASKQNKREAVNLRGFEEKLTAALVATNAPWALLDNANFCEAMEMFHPASDNFPLTAARARTEVLDRLVQKYDRNCKDILTMSNAITLVINRTNTGADRAKQTTYLALDEWRRTFVLAEGSDASVSPSVTELLSVLSTLPSTSPDTKVFLCTPTSGGAYALARRDLFRNASALHKPLTLMGACMIQQTALLLHELVLCSMSLEEALDNAVLTADALHVIPSLRQCVLRSIYSDNEDVEGKVSAFAQVSVASWRSIAIAVKQATRLEPFLLLAILEEKETSTSLSILRQLVDMSSSDMVWNTLRHTNQLLAPLHFTSALSELQTTTSGQLLALWIWLFGAATRSPLFDGNSDTLATSFMQRLSCYVEDHFVACLVLDPRVHGAGLSVSGLRRARGITVRMATALIPNFNENNFIRSYNDYMKQQGDFGEPGVWNAANTSNPMEFWGDYEGDQVHNQLAVVAKTVCSFVPHTCSVEELWAAHVQRSKAKPTELSKHHEKCTKIRHGAALNARVNEKDVVNRFQVLLDVENESSVEEMLQSNVSAQDPDEQQASSGNISVRSVLESVQDGMEEDMAGSETSSTPLDASWFDISSAGLDKIKNAMENYLSAAI